MTTQYELDQTSRIALSVVAAQSRINAAVYAAISFLGRPAEEIAREQFGATTAAAARTLAAKLEARAAYVSAKIRAALIAAGVDL